MKSTSLIILVFCVLFFFILPAAADTDHAIDGDFSSWPYGWSIEYSDTGDRSGSSITQKTSGGQDGGAYVSMYGWGGDVYGYGVGSVSIDQEVGYGSITKITYYYRYSGDGYGFGDAAKFLVYWNGALVDSFTLYSNGVSSWTQRTITVTNQPGAATGNIQFTLRVPGTESTQREFTVDLDTVQLWSVGDAPTVSSISSSPATSSSNTQPAPATITFTASGVSGNPDPQYLWVWGDGSQSSTGYNLNSVQHTYALPGQYTCTLYLTNDEGTATATNTVYIGQPLPSTDFYASPTTGAVPMAVTFILTSYEAGETYQWWFGDGNDPDGAPDSTQAQPVHTYTEAGVYSVILKVTNTAGTRTITKTDLITVTNAEQITTGQGAFYAPHSVQLRFVDSVYGNPLPGVEVSIVQSGSSSDIANILKWFGISDSSGITDTQQGITGNDGTISWLALPQLQYTISYEYQGTANSIKLYPQDSQYLIRIDTGTSPTRPEANIVFAATPNEDESEFTLSLNYSDPQTQKIRFWVLANNETIYTQNFSSSTMQISYLVENIRGMTYTWGYTAQQSDGSIQHDSRGITMKGTDDVPLWDLGLDQIGLGNEWYQYIAYLIMGLCAGIFSQSTARMGGIVLALCLGSLFWFVGWLPMLSGSIITLAAALAIIAYAARVDQVT